MRAFTCWAGFSLAIATRISGAWAGRIYDRLADRLGRESVFFDVDNIQLGVDFIDVLTKRVGACDALVAIIGKSWVSSVSKDGRRRLDDPDDFVRVEIETALKCSAARF